MNKKCIAILGSGITGLSAGLYLSRKGYSVHIFEKRDRIGGLVGGKIINDNIYEYGPHFFHTNNPKILSEIKNIVGSDLINFKRTILIKFMDQYFVYPLSIFEVLKKLPRKIVIKAILSLINNNFKRIFGRRKLENSETILLGYYGKVIYELFFKNYISSVWGIGPDKFSPEFANQRIPKISAAVFLNKILSPIRLKFSRKTTKSFIENVDGNHFTTKRGYRGIVEKIVETIKNHGGEIHLNSRVVGININNNLASEIIMKSGSTRSFKFDCLINTLPINEMISITEPKAPAEIINSAKFLKFRTLVFVGVLVNKPKVLPVSFMYFRQHSFNRVYDSSYFGHDTILPDTTILVSEVSCSVNDRWWNDEEYCKEMVINDLLKEDIIKKDEIIEVNVYRYKNGYPIYELGYEKHLGILLNYIGGIKNLETAGRQGLFQYINGHIAMQMGFEAAEKIEHYINSLDCENL